MKPSRYCLIGFCLFKVSGSLQEFIWSVAENETATLFPRLIILIPLYFCSHSLFFVCLQSVSFPEIKIIRPSLKMRPGWTNFRQKEVILFSSLPPSLLDVHHLISFFFPPPIFFLILPHTRKSSSLSLHRLLILFFFSLCPPLTSSVLSLPRSPPHSQCFHHFRLIPQNPLSSPPPIHIFKHKPAHWFQTKCVHSNISINWVGEALTLITATTLCFRHVGGIMDYY